MAMPIRRTKKTDEKPGPKQSVSDTKRELAMQARGSGKNAGKRVGPKARAQRLAAKQYGKSIKKQEVAAAKRGGTKPEKAGVKKVEASDKLKKKAAGTSIRTSTPYNRIKYINMSKKK
jgi:hypothetical protein